MNGKLFNAYEYTAFDDVVMHCPTRECAEIFTRHLESIGRKWSSGNEYSEIGTRFYEYLEDTCYNFCLGTYGNLDFYRKEGYTILEFGDFYWKECDSDLGNLEMDVCADDVCCLDKFFGGFRVGV